MFDGLGPAAGHWPWTCSAAWGAGLCDRIRCDRNGLVKVVRYDNSIFFGVDEHPEIPINRDKSIFIVFNSNWEAAGLKCKKIDHYVQWFWLIPIGAWACAYNHKNTCFFSQLPGATWLRSFGSEWHWGISKEWEFKSWVIIEPNEFCLFSIAMFDSQSVVDPWVWEQHVSNSPTVV